MTSSEVFPSLSNYVSVPMDLTTRSYLGAISKPPVAKPIETKTVVPTRVQFKPKPVLSRSRCVRDAWDDDEKWDDEQDWSDHQWSDDEDGLEDNQEDFHEDMMDMDEISDWEDY